MPEYKNPVMIDGSGCEEIDGQLGSLVQFDFDPHDNAHYGLVMVEGRFYTIPSDSVTAMQPEEEVTDEADPS